MEKLTKWLSAAQILRAYSIPETKTRVWKVQLSPLILWFMVEKNNALSSVPQSSENKPKHRKISY